MTLWRSNPEDCHLFLHYMRIWTSASLPSSFIIKNDSDISYRRQACCLRYWIIHFIAWDTLCIFGVVWEEQMKGFIIHDSTLDVGKLWKGRCGRKDSHLQHKFWQMVARSMTAACCMPLCYWMTSVPLEQLLYHISHKTTKIPLDDQSHSKQICIKYHDQD